MQTFTGHLRQMLPFHGQRSLVKIFHIQVLKYVRAGYITEQRDLVLQMIIQRMLTSADQDIRPDTHTLQILHRSLSRLGLQLAGSFDIGNQGYMDENGIFMSYVMLELSNGLQERLTFDIAHGTAYLNNGNMRLILIEIAVKTALDFVGNMGDNLHCASAVIAAALLVQNRPVDFTGGNVRILCQRFINKAFIMTKIQVCFSTVVSHEYLAVLNRVHGAGVNVDVRVKLLHSYFVATGFQKTSQRSCCDAFTETGYNTAGDKDVFYRHVRFLLLLYFIVG